MAVSDLEAARITPKVEPTGQPSYGGAQNRAWVVVERTALHGGLDG